MAHSVPNALKNHKTIWVLIVKINRLYGMGTRKLTADAFGQKLINASDAIKRKIKSAHDVDWQEVEEAFFASIPPYLLEKRTRHKTTPSTLYFIAETFDERLLKICFIIKDDTIWVKTAFDSDEEDIYEFLAEGGKIGCL